MAATGQSPPSKRRGREGPGVPLFPATRTGLYVNYPADQNWNLAQSLRGTAPGREALTPRIHPKSNPRGLHLSGAHTTLPDTKAMGTTSVPRTAIPRNKTQSTSTKQTLCGRHKQNKHPADWRSNSSKQSKCMKRYFCGIDPASERLLAESKGQAFKHYFNNSTFLP